MMRRGRLVRMVGGMKQLTLTKVGFERYPTTKRRTAFLAEMERVVPWSTLCEPVSDLALP
jgi:hypothetical protein